MPAMRIYKISYWPVLFEEPSCSEKHFYVKMTKYNFIGFLSFLRLNWPSYNFAYYIMDLERR